MIFGPNPLQYSLVPLMDNEEGKEKAVMRMKRKKDWKTLMMKGMRMRKAERRWLMMEH